MSKVIVYCDWCRKELHRYTSQIGAHSYCSPECRSMHLSKKYNPEGYRRHQHLSDLNARMNPNRMTMETRTKLRASRLGTGEGKSYEKTFSRHTHRIVMEQKLGRKLFPGEVVHHIDGNKRNNDPGNLMLFASQDAHAAWHAKYGLVMYGASFGKGGDAR